ncbi:MAG: hypothetical protein NTW04_04145, partial [Elusimicrobia bacterium]|nr:hypothetical protein [Elusimicrobiota bacterium]
CAAEDPTLWSVIRWSFSPDMEDIRQRADREFKVGSIKNIEVVKRSLSGRVTGLKITGSKSSYVLSEPEKIRVFLGAKAMRSTFFVLIPTYNSGRIEKLLIRGAGTGLGEGLCVRGAGGLAKNGKTYKEILAHYFPQTSLGKIS